MLNTMEASVDCQDVRMDDTSNVKLYFHIAGVARLVNTAKKMNEFGIIFIYALNVSNLLHISILLASREI